MIAFSYETPLIGDLGATDETCAGATVNEGAVLSACAAFARTGAGSQEGEEG